MLPDPLESQNVYVGKSPIPGAGQGLFAKRDINQFETVAFYNGFRLQNRLDFEEYSKLCHFKSSFADCHVYSVSTIFSEVLALPPWYSSLGVYNATLGHKINHHPTQFNVDFGGEEHPRFGNIGFIHAIKTIKKGQEILIDYSYPETAWYKTNYPWYKWK